MKQFFSHIRGAVVSTLVLAVVCCGLYPLIVFGISQLLFRDQANGSLITGADGNVRGSKLLGQAFSDAKYFHPRPSAAGNGYDATSSGSSNLGPTNPDFLASVDQRVADYRKENGLAADQEVPVDAVTASGSGLDPDISVANARLQGARVADARGMSVDDVLAEVSKHTTVRQWG